MYIKSIFCYYTLIAKLDLSDYIQHTVLLVAAAFEKTQL